MTRIEPTSMPWSTARAKRSTRTVVLPVPAPAETKTRPGASIAACCSEVGGRSTVALIASGPLHPAERGQLAPGGAGRAAARVVADVAGTDPLDEAAGRLLGPRHLLPEPVLV